MKTHLFGLETGGRMSRMISVNSTHVEGGAFYYTDDVGPLDAPDILPSGSTLEYKDQGMQNVCVREPA